MTMIEPLFPVANEEENEVVDDDGEDDVDIANSI